MMDSEVDEALDEDWQCRDSGLVVDCWVGLEGRDRCP